MAPTESMCEVVWSRGLLKKSVGLCHGAAGNGYCFLSMYRATGSEVHLSRALAFAKFVVCNWQEMLTNDRPHSLFEGLAGAVCFVIDCLNPSELRFSTYEIHPRFPL